MKIKNLNPVERHIEKITLAVAAAAALYLGYSGWAYHVETRPENSPEGKAGDYEAVVQKVTTKIGDLDRHLKQAPDLHLPPQPNYVEEWQKQAQHPLDGQLLAAYGGDIAPRHISAQGGGELDNGPGFKIVTPTVPGLAEPKAAASRGTIKDPQTGLPRDLDWVKVEATFPMKPWLDNLSGEADKLPAEQRVPQEMQRTVFVQVELERQQRKQDGTWPGPEDWKNVPGLKIGPPPPPDLGLLVDGKDVVARLGDLEKDVYNIIEPSFYQLNTPTAPVVPLVAPAPVAPPVKPPAVGPGPGPRPGPGPIPGPIPAGGGGAPVVVPFDAGPVGPGGPGGGGEMKQNLTIEMLKGQEQVTVWAYDETVKSGQEYRYRIRVKLFNPTYRSDFKLADPKQKTVQWLMSPWALASGTVKIDPNMFFFVTTPLGGDYLAAVKIYKWDQGRWIAEEMNAAPGLAVASPKTLDTGYLIVDVYKKGDNPRSEYAVVVLLDPNGNLVSHDQRLDADDAKRLELEKLLGRRPVPVAPAGGTGTPGGPGTPGTPGGPGRPPPAPPPTPGNSGAPIPVF